MRISVRGLHFMAHFTFRSKFTKHKELLRYFKLIVSTFNSINKHRIINIKVLIEMQIHYAHYHLFHYGYCSHSKFIFSTD